MSTKHGESDERGGRRCDVCDAFHGTLYICPSYSDELKAKLEQQTGAWRNDLRDPEWCDEQVRAGIPESVIQIMAMFAGVQPRSGRPS